MTALKKNKYKSVLGIFCSTLIPFITGLFFYKIYELSYDSDGSIVPIYHFGFLVFYPFLYVFLFYDKRICLLTYPFFSVTFHITLPLLPNYLIYYDFLSLIFILLYNIIAFGWFVVFCEYFAYILQRAVKSEY